MVEKKFVSDSSLQLALRELRTLFTSPRAIGVMVAVIVVLGISGPFQTFKSLPIGPRLAYWTAMTACSFATGLFFGKWAMTAMRRAKLPIYFRVVAGGFVAGLPVALVVSAINALTFENYGHNGYSVLANFGYGIAISTIVLLLFVLFDRTKHDGNSAGKPKLVERVPLAQRGKLISLSVQDHYVEVTTTKGTTLVLMRLLDAIDETGGVEGLRVHRSHWVALDGVKSAYRRDGKVSIVTSAGAELPVSRTYVGAVKKAGLLV